MDLRPLLALPEVARARDEIAAADVATLEEQLRIVRIAAPPLHEAERAAYIRERFAEAGLKEIRQDEVGNVLANLSSPSGRRSPPVVIAAHLDTVFPPGTDLTPRTSGARVFAPGITDNARGLAALLSVARTLVGSSIRTRHPIWFVATVGEEGIGDLRGVKHLFKHALRSGVHGFISLDGSGLRRVVHRAIGSVRLRAVVTGSGGHSWADAGAPNPVHALGGAITAMQPLPSALPALSTLTVARIGGGTSVNAIPAEAWLEIDMRSENTDVLGSLERRVREVLEEGVRAENGGRRRGSAALALRVQRIGERPAGSVPAEVPLVAAAMAATRAVGARPELAASSTDANVPLALGYPAVTIGAGGESGGIHTLHEWYSDEGGARGLQRALLTVLAAAGVDGSGLDGAGPAAGTT
jgi:tripeptide aminopeptidase